jgi:hypothetical protein
LAAALIFSGALAALVCGVGVAGTISLVTVPGASHALLEVATRTLLQRSVPQRLRAGRAVRRRGGAAAGSSAPADAVFSLDAETSAGCADRHWSR